MPFTKGLILLASFSLTWEILTGINAVLLRAVADWGVFSLAAALILALVETVALLGFVDRCFFRTPRSSRWKAVALKGVVHGKTIELAEAPGFPDGQEVSVTVEPVSAATSPTSPAALEALRRATGA